jgi:hypothetical protein
MTNAIKALLQMTSVSLQPVPSLESSYVYRDSNQYKVIINVSSITVGLDLYVFLICRLSISVYYNVNLISHLSLYNIHYLSFFTA